MSPDIRIAAPHCYTYRTESPLHSGFVGHPPATLEKRVPINIRRHASGAATAGSSVQTVTDVGDWRMRMDMIDVGNGSCHLIRSGTSAVLFDCGSLGAPAVGSQTVVPALRALGVRTIDAVVISHPNLDHYGALPEVVRAFSVPRVLVTPQFIKWARHGAAFEALRAARASGASVEKFSKDDQRQFGSMSWRVLHPAAKSVFADSKGTVHEKRGFFLSGIVFKSPKSVCQ